MTRVRVESFTISLDGYGAGPNQDAGNPLGVGGNDLHHWLLPTRTFQRTLFGKDGGTTGVDEDFASRGFRNVGAWILGRNMFGPVRGPWPDMSWKGWWGGCGAGNRRTPDNRLQRAAAATGASGDRASVSDWNRRSIRQETQR